MQAILALLGFVAFMGAIELIIYIVNRMRKRSGKESFDIDASAVLVVAIIGLIVFSMIGELYIRLTQ